HGGMDQEHRTRVVERLRSGRTELLVATDVAARGLDIDMLTHVVNHDVPQSSEAYVHRIGRVGRAGREGVAITLVPPSKVHALRAVERLTGQPIEFAPVPTAADLRSARLERTASALRERLVADLRDEESGDGVREMLAGLADEFDPLDVAAAALRPLPAATGAPADAADIPDVTPPSPARRRPAPRACSSTRAAPAACARRTSWARSPTSPACPAGTSARSRSTSGTPSWRSPSTPRTTCCAASAAAPRSRGGGRTSAATAGSPPRAAAGAT